MKIETAGQKLNGLPSIIEKTMREERRILLYPLLLIQLLWGSSQGEESIPESGRIQWSQKNYSVNETQGLVYLQGWYDCDFLILNLDSHNDHELSN